jgi:hypothetical protein
LRTKPPTIPIAVFLNRMCGSWSAPPLKPPHIHSPQPSLSGLRTGADSRVAISLGGVGTWCASVLHRRNRSCGRCGRRRALPVLRYAKVEDAIARANDTEFGLGGSVWSKNLERAFAGLANQFGHGLDQPASQPAARHSLQGRQAVRHRSRTGPRRPRGIYSAQDHQHGQAAGLRRPLAGRP